MISNVRLYNLNNMFSLALKQQPWGGTLLLKSTGRYCHISVTAREFLLALRKCRSIELAIVEIAKIYDQPLDSIQIDVHSFYEEICSHLSANIVEEICRNGLQIVGNIELLTPTIACIELSYQCGGRCSYCYHSSYRPSTVMSIDAWVYILRRLEKHGVFRLFLTGGEPLLHPQFSQIMDVINDSFIVSINSSGIGLTDGLMQCLKKVVDFQVSLDSVDDKINDTLRFPGSGRAAKETITRLLKKGIPVSVSSVLTPESTPTIEHTIKYLNRVGVRLLKLGTVINKRTNINTGVDIDSIYNLAESLFIGKVECNAQNQLNEFTDSPPCNILEAGEFYINPQGYAKPCSFIDEHNFCGHYSWLSSSSSAEAICCDSVDMLFSSYRSSRALSLRKDCKADFHLNCNLLRTYNNSGWKGGDKHEKI